MPKSSRHKSHRTHRHSSDSEVEESSRERKRRNGTDRESKGSGSEKRKKTSFLQFSEEKDGLGIDNADLGGEYGRKHSDSATELASVAERWNGHSEDVHMDGKELKMKEFRSAYLKSKYSRRHDGLSERKEESNERDETTRRRLEKDSARRERSSHQSEAKERDRETVPDKDRVPLIERGSKHKSEKDKEHQQERDRDRRQERDRETLVVEQEHSLDRGVEDVVCKKSSVVDSRNNVSGMGCTQGDYSGKVDVEDTEWLIEAELNSPDLEKDLEKRNRKRDCTDDKNRWHEDDRNVSDRRLASKVDHVRNSTYKEEHCKNGRYKEKCLEDFDRDDRPSYDKHRDGRSSTDSASGRSENKHNREGSNCSEKCNKRSRVQDNDRECSPHIDEYKKTYKDGRGRKKFSDDTKEDNDLKPRNAKESQVLFEKNTFGRNKVDVDDDGGMPEFIRVGTTISNNRPVRSPTSANFDKDKYSSKLAESTHRTSLSEERHHNSTTALEGVSSVAGLAENVSASHSMERKGTVKEFVSDDFLAENSIASQYEMTPRSDCRTSPIQLTEKSPSSASSSRYSSRMSARRHLDEGNSFSKDEIRYSTNEHKEQDFPSEKHALDDNPQRELSNSNSIRAGSLFHTRNDHFSGNSQSHCPPSPSVCLGIDGPSVLGSFEDGNRVQTGDHKSNRCYRRIGDLHIGRGQTNAWKGIPNWPSPVANGFIPFLHGPPPGGFHPVVQPFPAPPLFGVRPAMDLSHSGVPYPMHETPYRYSGHNHPFGWQNPTNDSSPLHFRGWDGISDIFGDDSNIHDRSNWEQKRHLISNRVPDMSGEPWKGQIAGSNRQNLAHQKEPDSLMCVPGDIAWAEQCGHQQQNGPPQVESVEVKQSSDTSIAKSETETSINITHGRTPQTSELSEGGANLCHSYLSKLDISLDLACPELYREWIKFKAIRTDEDIPRDTNAFMLVCTRKNVVGIRVSPGSSDQTGSSLFPAITDTIFQRAISLYKKHDGAKAKISSSIIQTKEERDSPKASGVEEIGPPENFTSEASLQGKDDPVSNMEGDAKNLVKSEGDLVDVLSPAQDKESDVLSDAVVFLEDSSLGCEALMPECRVNLSRIHYSPENTH